jgi:hypothetical protein
MNDREIEIIEMPEVDLIGYDDEDYQTDKIRLDSERVIVEPKRPKGRPRKYPIITDEASLLEYKKNRAEYNKRYYSKTISSKDIVNRERDKQKRRRELLAELAELDREDI